MSILDENCAGQKPVVQWPQVSPKTFILLRLGWGTFSKSALHTVIFTVPSKLRHANKTNEWGQKSDCFGKESFSEKGHTVVGPLQRPGFLWGFSSCFSSFSDQIHSLQGYLWCGEGKVYTHRKFSMSMTSRKMCGWWWPTSWTWVLRMRQKQMRDLRIYKWKGRMKNWTRPTMKYEH